MAITLMPLSRRRFLQSTLALGAGVLISDAWGQEKPAEARERFVLFSDTHIAADPKRIERGANMTDNLTAAVAAAFIIGKTKPAALFINGDLALKDGQPDDYKQLLATLKPVLDADVPVHLSLGNHDQRDNFWNAVPAGVKVVEGRQVTVVESAHATWIVLDTLDQTNVTPGKLGEAQLKWLTAFLDTPDRATKPVLVMTHHNPERLASATQPAAAGAPKPAKVAGIVDGAALMEILLPRKQVKALIYGHLHKWEIKIENGLHLINLPAVAYVFGNDQTSAWTDWNLSDTGAEVVVNTLDPKHKMNLTKTSLAWR